MNAGSIDIKLLQCFEVLMAERSVSRAATRLSLSQPATSHALGRLRRLFNDPLLLKGHGGMIPTARALELEEQVRTVLEGADRLVQKQASFDPLTARRSFSIMAAEHVEYLLAPALIERLQHEAPGIDVEFRPHDRARALAMLERGEIDFRLGQWPKPPAQTLRVKMLFRDRLVCLVCASNREARNRITLEQFLSTPHVRIKTARISVAMEALDRAVAASRRNLRVMLQVHNAFALAHVVSRSDLVACVPRCMARKLEEKFPLRVLPLPLDVPELVTGLYWHERIHHQPAYRWFRRLVAETATFA